MSYHVEAQSKKEVEKEAKRYAQYLLSSLVWKTFSKANFWEWRPGQSKWEKEREIQKTWNTKHETSTWGKVGGENIKRVHERRLVGKHETWNM